MQKMPKYHKLLQTLSIPVMSLFVLMIFLLTFSQMIMETSAYSFMLTKNNVERQEKNKVVLESYVNKENEIKDKASTKSEKEKNSNTNSNVKAEEVYKKTMSSFLSKPVKGGITTSGFGDIIDRSVRHIGHDWAVEVGTPIMAAADGIVTKAYLSDSYGYNILVQHSYGISTRYAHLSQLKVEYGDNVKRGEVIGLSGNTGDSTGPHLHFEVIENGERVNPLNYIASE